MISNQDPLRYGTAMQLVLITMEDGARSSVIISSFKMNECGKFKMENEHHSGARYLYLSKLMGNSSCNPSLCTKTRNAPKISNIIYHCTR